VAPIKVLDIIVLNSCFPSNIYRFCRGSSCKRCSATAYLGMDNPAIDKLHSSWIDDSILAMQRPSDAIIEEANLIEQFKTHNIVAVFNLTEPGEHPFCGYGNTKVSGFPYNPETLMMAGSEFKCNLLTYYLSYCINLNSFSFSCLISFSTQLNILIMHGLI
jgi:hypothetical protein